MLKKYQILLATSCLSLGIFSSSINAATVTATGNAAFSSDVNWLPNKPVAGDDINYNGNNFSITADVSDLYINSIDLTNVTPGPLFIAESAKVGRINGNNNVLETKFLNDNKILELSGDTTARDYTGTKTIDFNGKVNSKVRITSQNFSILSTPFNFTSSGPAAGTIEIADFADTDFDAPISNVKNLVVNGFPRLKLNANVSLTENFEVGGAQVTVADGVNITAKRLRGSSRSLFYINYLIFQGNSIVDVPIGQEPDNTIAYLLFDVGIPRTVEFKKPVNIFYDFQLSTNSNIKLGGNVEGREIEVLRFAPSQNIVEFNNIDRAKSNILIGGCWGDTLRTSSGLSGCGGNIFSTTIDRTRQINNLVDGPLRGICRVNILRLSGASVEYYNPVYIKNLDFSNSSRTAAAIFLLDDANLGFDLADVNVTTASTKRIHSIHVSIDQHVRGKVGSFTNPIATLKTLKDVLLQVDTLDFYTDVSTLTKDTGILEFIKPNSFSYSVGDNNNDLGMKEIRFTESAEIRGSGYAKTMTVASGKTAKFLLRKATNGGNVNPFMETTEGFVLKGTGSKLIIGDGDIVTPARFNGVEVRGKILTETAGQNEVLFEGNINLRAQIGEFGQRLKDTTFAANSLNKVITYARDIHSDTINFGKATINIDAGGTLDGVTTAVSPTVNFGQHILIFTGGNSKFQGTPIFNVYFANVDQDESNSHITVTGSNGNLNMASVDNLTFNITDQSTLIPPASGIIYNFYRLENNGTISFTANDKVKVNNLNNPFVFWRYQNGQLVQTRNIEGGIGTITASEEDKQRALLLLDDLDAVTARAYLDFLVANVTAGDLVTAADSLNRILEATNPTSQVVIDTINNYQSSMVNTRMDNQVTNDFRIADAGTGAVAAGDMLSRNYGVWFQPFYSRSIQKFYRNQSGYHANTYGGTVGVDNNINDVALVGIAASYIQNKVHYKNKKAGDKSTIDSYILSLYGMREINNNWYTQGILSIGTNKVKNSKPRFNSNGRDIAKGSYRSTSYGAEITAGYNWLVSNDAIVTPIVGAKYSRFDADHYTETGADYLSLKVKKKSYNKLEAIVGGKITSSYAVNDYTLMPQLQAFINHNLLKKSPKAFVSLQGVSSPPVPILPKKHVRTTYNFALGVVTEIKLAEYEFNYHLGFAKKYMAHQFALKIKVKL